ncbi:MAG: carboxypeptidase-like regulatory domain-containing protein [Terriglobales bacterium]
MRAARIGRWLALLLLAAAAAAQFAQRPGMSYERENPPNLARLDVRRIRGKVVDRMHTAVPGVALGLYTETAPHKLLALGTSDTQGNFDFGKKIAAGNYRLIAKYPGLCTANIPLQVNPHGSGKKIILHMQYPGLGFCSFALLH